VAERLKGSCQHQEKGFEASGRTEPGTIQKNPQLLCNGDCIICGFQSLKKWWQKRNYYFTTTHWPVAIKLSAFYFIS
jgi:hypothetical protein